MTDRRRRLRRPGRGRGDHAPPAGGRPGGRAAGLSPAAGADRPRPPRRGERLAADFAPEDKFDALPTARAAAAGVTAFLTVQEGCDKFCTFCVVPYTRGAEYSRPAGGDRGRGARAGRPGRARGHPARPERQRLRRRRAAWPALIRRLAAIPGLDRIRYTTSHPRDMDDALIAAHGEVEALMPYLHLPVQSGSDRVLKAMNRGAHRRDYLRLIERIRAARPDIAFRRLHRRLPRRDATPTSRRRSSWCARSATPAPSRSSIRAGPGTPAAAMPGQVAEEVKAERLARLQALLDEQQRAFNAAQVGRTLPVLFEKPGRHAGPGRRPQPLSAGGALRGRRIA